MRSFTSPVPTTEQTSGQRFSTYPRPVRATQIETNAVGGPAGCSVPGGSLTQPVMWPQRPAETVRCRLSVCPSVCVSVLVVSRQGSVELSRPAVPGPGHRHWTLPVSGPAATAHVRKRRTVDGADGGFRPPFGSCCADVAQQKP